MSSSPTLCDIDIRRPVTIVIMSRVFSPDGSLSEQDRNFIYSLTDNCKVWVQAYMAETFFTPVARNRDHKGVLSVFKVLIGDRFGPLVFTERMHGFCIDVDHLSRTTIESLHFFLDAAARTLEVQGFQIVRTLHPQTLHFSLNGTGINQTMAGIKALSEGSQLLFVDVAGYANSQPAEADLVMIVGDWAYARMRLMIVAMLREHIQQVLAQERQPQDRQA
jgi:hypothetical protein